MKLIYKESRSMGTSRNIDDDNDEMANSCFLSLGERTEVTSYNYPNCNDLQNSLDMVTDELQKFIDEYNKVAQEKKVQMILLEASQIEVDLLTKELEEKKIHLNTI